MNNLGDVLETDEGVGALAPKAVKPKTVRIVLEENDNIPPTGQFFGVQGQGFMLKPGEEADVPMQIINILNDAMQATPQIDPSTRQVVGYRKKLRFPYRVVMPEMA